MSFQEHAVAGSHVVTLPRRRARAFPIGDGASRQYGPEDRRQAVSQGIYVGPWGATPVEHAESRLSQVLRRVDQIALGLTWGAVFALWPFAFCFLVGLL